MPWASGEKYLVKYRIPSMHRVPRFMLATFIGVVDGSLVFSGRPVFGTTYIRKEHLEEAVLVSADDPREPFADRKRPI
jgi:hypothetical protein